MFYSLGNFIFLNRQFIYSEKASMVFGKSNRTFSIDLENKSQVSALFICQHMNHDVRSCCQEQKEMVKLVVYRNSPPSQQQSFKRLFYLIKFA